ncbi:IS701 family transposase [Streptomyces sp. NPDC088387]|uniref:IS701 family transposase n=1 Tax=Streptomyces sp. NPDC088387 TaxID=3365859 RepID=UPI0037FB8BFE
MTVANAGILSDVDDLRVSFASPDALLDEFGSTLFASLARSDQRHKGMTYLRGLLGARGRKSIRNIAAHVGGATTEQSLHHFISDSTWEWTPLRRALARHLARVAPPQAWVVQPLVIPKAGEYSVGVDRQFFPALGQVLNAQQAVGVWAVAEDYCYPVNWRLHLPASWLADKNRRNRALVPEGTVPETLGECMVRAFAEVVADWGVPARPVVMESLDGDLASVRDAFRTARVPVFVKIGSTFNLVDQAFGRGILPARHIMNHLRHLRRPVVLPAPTAAGSAALGVAAATKVRLPGRLAARHQDLLLLGTGRRGGPWPGELWLTNLVHGAPAELARLTCLRGRVDHAVTSVADRVGVRDYTGRSYNGWHRHITMASAAYAVAMLSE